MTNVVDTEEPIANARPKRDIVIFAILVLASVIYYAYKLRSIDPETLQAKLVELTIPDEIGIRLCQRKMHLVSEALDNYAIDHGGNYPENQDQLIPEYLAKFPQCSIANRMTYRTEFGTWKVDKNGKVEEFYQVICAGDYHGLKGRYPAQHSHYGFLKTDADFLRLLP